MALPAKSLRHEDEDFQRLKSEEVFALRTAVMGAERLVSHEHPDLDALVSLAIAQLYRRFNHAHRDIPVSFVAGGLRDFPKGTLALDIGDARGLRSTSSGGMMIKASSAGGSCCMALARILRDDDFYIIDHLVREISASDEDREKGTIERIWSRHNLWPYKDDRTALTVTSIFDIFQSLHHSSYDYEMYELILRLIEGTLIRGHKRRFSRERNPWDGVETYYGGRFAILPIGAGIYQGRALEHQGVEVSLHTVPLKNMRGHWSMALHRGNRVAMNLAELFRGRLDGFPGIYVSESLVGWGAKGGGLEASEPEMRLVRDKLILQAKGVLGPWYSSHH